MKKKFLLFLSFIIIISKCYAMDCCDNSYSETKLNINTEDNFNNHLKNTKTKNIEELEKKNLNTLKFQRITKQFNYHNEKGICVFISTIQNIFRMDCYLKKLNECLEIVRNNIEEINEDLIYGIYDLLMINNEIFNANSKEETKDVFEKYLTVSKMCKTDAEKNVNDIPNLKFCDDNHRFIHYTCTNVLVKVLFGLLNKILGIGKKKKVFILDTPYVFSYFAMNEKMNKNEDKIKQKEKEEKRNFDKKKDETFEKILKGEEDAFESDFFIILLDDELLQECDIYNFSYNISEYEICGMIKILGELQLGADMHAIAIVKEENKMNFYNDNEREIFEYNPQKPWDYRFFNKCLFFEKTENVNLEVNYNSYQYFINKQKEEPFPIIYRNGEIYATLFEWYYLEGEEDKDNPQILAYSWGKKIERVGKNNEDFFKEVIEKIDNTTSQCKLIDGYLQRVGSFFLKIEDATIIEKLKKCYEMKIKKDKDYEIIINKRFNISPKSFLDDFLEDNLSHCEFLNASVLYKDLGKEEFFSKTIKLKYLAKTIVNGRIFGIYEDNNMKIIE